MYPFPVAVFGLLPCFIEILRVKAHDCEGEDKLQEAKHEVDDIRYGEA